MKTILTASLLLLTFTAASLAQSASNGLIVAPLTTPKLRPGQGIGIKFAQPTFLSGIVFTPAEDLQIVQIVLVLKRSPSDKTTSEQVAKLPPKLERVEERPNQPLRLPKGWELGEKYAGGERPALIRLSRRF